MDALEKELLFHELNNYGYQLVQTHVDNPEQTLARMLKANDLRVLEGVPVVLTHVLMQGPSCNFGALEKNLPRPLQRRFRLLAAVTYFFLFWVPNSKAASTVLLAYLRQREPGLLDEVKKKLESKQKLVLGEGVTLDVERLENTFKNYVVAQLQQVQESLVRKLEQQRQTNLLEALQELFTEKQKNILFKLLNKEALTKTEREYYSRTIKPRLRALCNSEFQSFAATLLAT